MPLYLIRETVAPTLSTVAGVKVHEIEIRSGDIVMAAEEVFERPPGPIDLGRMSFRDSGLPFDPARYAGVADIVAGDRSTVPVRRTLEGERRFVDAAEEVLGWHQEVAMIEGGDDPKVCLYHLLHSLIDQAHHVGDDFGELLKQVVECRVSELSKPRLAITNFEFGTDPASASPESIRDGGMALMTHTDRAGLVVENDEVARFHLLHSLIEYCEDKGIDFVEVVEQVRGDRPSSTVPAQAK